MTNDHAYIVGVALGDGNLSNPNGRTLRLRITCDLKYPQVVTEITDSLTRVFPRNIVSTSTRNQSRCLDISVYSNSLSELLPWKLGQGTKIEQGVKVPDWILANKEYSIACLRGLLQTDGSIYYDRSYLMLNFTNLSQRLINDVFTIITNLGFTPKIQQSIQPNGNTKYVVRVTKNTQELIDCIQLKKA